MAFVKDLLQLQSKRKCAVCFFLKKRTVVTIMLHPLAEALGYKFGARTAFFCLLNYKAIIL